jgi:hypothetical protein
MLSRHVAAWFLHKGPGVPPTLASFFRFPYKMQDWIKLLDLDSNQEYLIQNQ